MEHKKIFVIFWSRIKTFALLFFLLLVFAFVFGLSFLPDNSQFKDFLGSNDFKEDILIVFNSGGWGDTPIEEAKDLTPIIEGIQETISQKGYRSAVVPYVRSAEGFMGRMGASRETFSYFRKQSAESAAALSEFIKENPGKRILLVGLSNGAVFVDETMKKLKNAGNSVFAIEIGMPFWEKKTYSENILRLDNDNGDSLTAGQVSVLVPTALKAPFKWILAKITGSGESFSEMFFFSTHQYCWDSPKTRHQIVSFLDSNLGN
jgi:hypothetical protein